ncbi:hypothetical protein bas13_0037 [Escherichia phage LeonhardEuler]|uniref:Uncharacterized protein n=1 Tax=Escherichia phage LeonhardEuler TaxID=2851977 RepID=A0AAE7VWC8_9CAUD|nr:hypothetical protein bas13_0037 [Escherichia phage LeonhardEuler]UKS89213.1 hypothetical protein BPP3_21 [Escherichia phage CLB_P3]UNI73310.1 hypothetical protein [Escherichia phage CLB_P3]
MLALSQTERFHLWKICREKCIECQLPHHLNFIVKKERELSENEKQQRATSLPGLNINLDDYQTIWIGKKQVKKIPFSDWLPPDFVNVLCTIGIEQELHIGYYSPGRNSMMLEVNGKLVEFKSSDLGFWLKAVA